MSLFLHYRVEKTIGLKHIPHFLYKYKIYVMGMKEDWIRKVLGTTEGYENSILNISIENPDKIIIDKDGDFGILFDEVDLEDDSWNLLPIAMNISAHTIGLDLIPTQPLSPPTGLITYYDEDIYTDEDDKPYTTGLDLT